MPKRNGGGNIAAAVTVGVILGSGLGTVVDALLVEDAISVPFGDVPFCQPSTAPSHTGAFVIGRPASSEQGSLVCVLKGRLHYYEGHEAQDIVFPVQVMRELGAQNLLIVSAAGGIARHLEPGDIVTVSNHVNLFGPNPLRGPNDARVGVRWPHLKDPYSASLRAAAAAVVRDAAIERVHESGVYFFLPGPSGATRSELRAVEQLGGDVYGMSTTPEVVAALHCGISEVAVFCVITDQCFWDQSEDPTIEQCLAAAQSATPRVLQLLQNLLIKLR